MDYKNNSNTGLIIVADCMLLSVEYIGNVHLFFNTPYSISRAASIDSDCGRLPTASVLRKKADKLPFNQF